MKKLLYLLFVSSFCHSLNSQDGGNALIPFERHSFHSTVLDEERTYQIYLPPSYSINEKGNYSIIYLVDGDYNFHYSTGLVELLSSVSGKIPECIVVGISDKGNAEYKKDCAPAVTGGLAPEFMDFIGTELKAHVDHRYRTSKHDVIIGHSLGGLFVTNYLMKRPNAFDHFVAIDPSLWWADYEIIDRADSLFAGMEDLESDLFLSLADTKQMGVLPFVGVLDKHFPTSSKWHFNHYENENHGSVAYPTMKHALETIFTGWHISRKTFYGFSSAQDVIDHYKAFLDRFDTSFTLPSASVSNIVYFYFRKEQFKDLEFLEEQIGLHFPASLDDYYNQLAANYVDKGELEKAKDIYYKMIAINSKSIYAHDRLASHFRKKGELDKANEYQQNAINLAKSLKVRQWFINELESH